MVLKLVSILLECYNFGLLNVILMATTKKISIEYSQKGMTGESKHYKNQINTEKGNNEENEGTNAIYIHRTQSKTAETNPFLSVSTLNVNC